MIVRYPNYNKIFILVMCYDFSQNFTSYRFKIHNFRIFNSNFPIFFENDHHNFNPWLESPMMELHSQKRKFKFGQKVWQI